MNFTDPFVRFRMMAFTLAAIAAFGSLRPIYAASPGPVDGSVQLIAQRGVHQPLEENGDPNACTALKAISIEHNFIENTLGSIQAAFEAGADLVEVDVRQTKDGQFVLFHDDILECRTNGRGRIADTNVSALKKLDVGYGYSADGGRTFPLRGKGVGQMTTLEEALRAFPDRGFMIQFKTSAINEADAITRYLDARHLSDSGRLVFFGAAPAVQRLKELRPKSRTWTDRDTKQCTQGYLAWGWAGYVPPICRGGMIVVPTNLLSLIWGWPDTFMARMREADVGMLALGKIRLTGGFTRVDTAEELDQLPSNYGGYVWTDRIEILGPIFAKRFHAPQLGN